MTVHKYSTHARNARDTCQPLPSPYDKLVQVNLVAVALRVLFMPLVHACLSVCLLLYRVFVRLTKDTTYLTGNEGQNISMCGFL